MNVCRARGGHAVRAGRVLDSVAVKLHPLARARQLPIVTISLGVTTRLDHLAMDDERLPTLPMLSVLPTLPTAVLLLVYPAFLARARSRRPCLERCSRREIQIALSARSRNDSMPLPGLGRLAS